MTKNVHKTPTKRKRGKWAGRWRGREDALLAHRETTRVEARLLSLKEVTGKRCTSPEDVFRMCKGFAGMKREAFFTITLTAKNRCIDLHLTALGTVDECIVYPREIFRPALVDSASAIIVVHNHPSGDPAPSEDHDLRTTHDLAMIGRLLGVKVLDHVVIGCGRKTYVSMAEADLYDFDNARPKRGAA